jgi:hypothetical protein
VNKPSTYSLWETSKVQSVPSRPGAWGYRAGLTPRGLGACIYRSQARGLVQGSTLMTRAAVTGSVLEQVLSLQLWGSAWGWGQPGAQSSEDLLVLRWVCSQGSLFSLEPLSMFFLLLWFLFCTQVIPKYVQGLFSVEVSLNFFGYHRDLRTQWIHIECTITAC